MSLPAAIRNLSTEMLQFFGERPPRSVGGDERGVVDEGEEGGFQQLHDDQRTRDCHERDSEGGKVEETSTN